MPPHAPPPEGAAAIFVQVAPLSSVKYRSVALLTTYAVLATNGERLNACMSTTEPDPLVAPIHVIPPSVDRTTPAPLPAMTRSPEIATTDATRELPKGVSVVQVA